MPRPICKRTRTFRWPKIVIRPRGPEDCDSAHVETTAKSFTIRNGIGSSNFFRIARTNSTAAKGQQGERFSSRDNLHHAKHGPFRQEAPHGRVCTRVNNSRIMRRQKNICVHAGQNAKKMKKGVRTI
jgi:hypothetical protein